MDEEIQQRYRELELGSEAIDFINESLASGKTLAQCCLQSKRLKYGKVTTFLPPDITPEQASHDFTSGILPEPPSETHIHYTDSNGIPYRLVPKPNNDSILVDVIAAFLAESEDHGCIFEDQVHEPTDPWFVEGRYSVR